MNFKFHNTKRQNGLSSFFSAEGLDIMGMDVEASLLKTEEQMVIDDEVNQLDEIPEI